MKKPLTIVRPEPGTISEKTSERQTIRVKTHERQNMGKWHTNLSLRERGFSEKSEHQSFSERERVLGENQAVQLLDEPVKLSDHHDTCGYRSIHAKKTYMTDYTHKIPHTHS